VKSGDKGESWFLGGVLVTCMCGLMLQIMETRVLSVIGYYHLAFFAIGIAMMGMTAGALAVYYRFGEVSPATLPHLLCRVMCGFAWSVAVSLIVLLSLAIPSTFEPTLRFVVSWGVTILVLLPPYVFLGMAVSLALTRSPYRVSLVYGVDLLGAALGCLVTLGLLTYTDTYTAILLVGAMGAVAGLCFSASSSTAIPSTSVPRTSGVKPALAALVVMLLIAGTNQILGTSGLRPLVVKNQVERTFKLTEERWNSFSRIKMVMFPKSDAFQWSPSPHAPKVQLDQASLNIDGAAGTPIYRYGGDPAELDFLKYDVTALGYYIRDHGRAAVIGIGGGRDLMTASVFGFRDITGVEYNPIIVRLFATDYRDFSGSDKVPGLRIFVDDARSWFARSTENFDSVQMSMIDTWAATGAGAFTLSESGLYTVNGWRRFLARLTPQGVFSVSRWYSPEHLDETGRVLALAMASLIEEGVNDPASHIYLAANGNLSTLLVGRSALSAEDLARLDSAVQRLGYVVLAAPGRPGAEPIINRIMGAKSTAELVDLGQHSRLNSSPTWDDSPFFFNQLRLADPVTMLRVVSSTSAIVRGNLTATLTLVTLIALSTLIVVVVAVIPASRAIRGSDTALTLWGSLYFLMIGVAFMFVEISLIQRMSLFLGHPVLGLAIVLFSLILSTGIGSLASERLMTLGNRSLIGWPLALALYLATLPLWLGPLLEQAESGSLLLRVAVCLLIVVPAGILMGLMFPTGMRLAGAIDTRITPWLWALNGAAGVFASGAAVLLAISKSLNYPLWVGAVFYAILILPSLRLRALSSSRRESTTPGVAPIGGASQSV
jgi:hypothetical protein